MKKKTILTLLLIISISSVSALETEREWRMEITVESNVDEKYRDYPVNISIPGGELDSQTTHDIDPLCDLSGSNLGFINIEEEKEYDFWVEEGNCNSGEFTAWINIPFIQANEEHTFYLYTGQDYQNENQRREVFQLFEDFSTYSPNTRIDNHGKWNIESISGREEEFGQADINLDDQLSLISEGGYTTVTHPFGFKRNGRHSLDVNSEVDNENGLKIGITDGTTNQNGKSVSGYFTEFNQTGINLVETWRPNIEETESQTLQNENTNILTGQETIKSLSLTPNNVRTTYEGQQITDSTSRFDERTNLKISAPEDSEADINWVRIRQKAQEEPTVHNIDPNNDIEEVETDKPSLDTSDMTPSGEVEGFNWAKLEIQDINYDHWDNQDLDVIFKSPDYGILGYETVSNGETPEAIWRDLEHGREYEWYALICDNHNNCNDNPESTSQTFEINHETTREDLNETYERQDLFYGLRGDDHQPQGFLFELSENEVEAQPDGKDHRAIRSIYDDWIVMTRDHSNQLQPGMETNTYGLKQEMVSPDNLHRYYEFIDEPGGDDVPLWFDSLTTVDRANQYAMASERDWAVDTTGKPYEPGQAYVRTEMFEHVSGNREDWIREDRADGNQPKPSRAMANSIAVSAPRDAFDIYDEHEEGYPGESGNLIKGPLYEEKADTSTNRVGRGMGFWINPDDLKVYHSSYGPFSNDYYSESLEDLVHNSGVLSINGPSAGVGYHLPESYDEGDYTIETHADTVTTVVGDIYWEGDYLSSLEDPREDDSSQPETLNPYMCGDDRGEYLLEELGQVDNSREDEGRYACASHNNACVSWDAGEDHNGRKLFQIGEYANTQGPYEDIGRTKNSEEKCIRYDFEYPRFDGENIETDPTPAWYPQDLSPEICRENDLVSSTRGVRWIEKSQIEENPMAFKGGVNNDINPYLYNDKGIDSMDLYEYDSSLETDELDLSPGDQTTVPAGNPSDSPHGDGHKSITAGFCAGDDESEYLQHQDCFSDFCFTDTEIIGVSDHPNTCVLEANETIFGNNIDSFESFEETSLNGDEGERRLYEEEESVTIQRSGGTEQITCYQGTWFQDDNWPVIEDLQDQYEINLGQSLGIQFEILNPQDTASEFEVELKFDQGEDIEPFAEVIQQDGTTYTTEVEPSSLQTQTIAIEGGRVLETTDDNEIEVTVSNDDLQDNDGFDFEVVVTEDEEATGAQQTGATELPGPPTPAIILVLIITTIATTIRRSKKD